MSDPYVLGPFGEHISLLHPDRSPLLIRTIARSLSRLPRYTSHTRGLLTYSVGQHSWRASYLVPPPFALEALLHDASEAYLNDLSSPVKGLCPDYVVLEKRFELAIAGRYGLPLEQSSCVKMADLIMLTTEKRDLMCWDSEEWPITRGIIPLKERLRPHWHWKYTEWLFLCRFEELKNGK
jgi:uncharacterized protein